MGISLWLVPSSQDVTKLKRIMNAETRKLHSSSPESYPEFDPHVTLASLPHTPFPNLSSIISAEISTLTTPLTIEFKSIEIGDHFFRSVYLALRLSSTLSTLQERICTKLNIQPRTPAFPHLSLCYITDEDAQNMEREAFLRQLENNGKVRSVEDSKVAVNCGEFGEPDEWMYGFEVAEIWVVRCEGPVKEWNILDKISL